MTASLATGAEKDEALDGVLSEQGAMDHYLDVETIPERLLMAGGHHVLGREIAAVLAQFGQTSVFRLASREGSPVAVCYAMSGYLVVFRAGAMGGWTRITGITFVQPEHVSFAMRCGDSGVLKKWFAVEKKYLVTPHLLANALKLKALPANGLISVREVIVDGKSMMMTTAVAYAHDGDQLRWLDVSELTEL